MRVVCALVLLFLLSVGAAQAQMAPRYIEFGDRRMYLDCSGNGSPTVVFEADLQGSSADWTAVHQPLAARTRVCSYDRVGHGLSRPDASSKPSEQPLEDLRLMLAAAGERSPYILVGNGFGGLLVQLYARKYPQDVAGLVLVDPDDEELAARYQTSMPMEYQGKSYRRWMREDPDGIAVAAAYAQARGTEPLPRVPLVVVAHYELPLYQRLADSVPGGRLEVADSIGLHIPEQQPQRIVQAVLPMIDAPRPSPAPWPLTLPWLLALAALGLLGGVFLWRGRAQ